MHPGRNTRSDSARLVGHTCRTDKRMHGWMRMAFITRPCHNGMKAVAHCVSHAQKVGYTDQPMYCCENASCARMPHVHVCAGGGLPCRLLQRLGV